MLLGIGTDILNIATIKPLMDNLADPFFTKTFTADEMNLIYNREIPLYSIATRFAGKEAVFKCLSIHGDAIRLNEIEILENANGQPSVTLYGNAKILADQKGISQIFISLSYDSNYAVAYATAISD